MGPYELHDFFLYYFLRCGFRPSKIFFLAARTFKGMYDEETIKKMVADFLPSFLQPAVQAFLFAGWSEGGQYLSESAR